RRKAELDTQVARTARTPRAVVIPTIKADVEQPQTLATMLFSARRTDTSPANIRSCMTLKAGDARCASERAASPGACLRTTITRRVTSVGYFAEPATRCMDMLVMTWSSLSELSSI